MLHEAKDGMGWRALVKQVLVVAGLCVWVMVAGGCALLAGSADIVADTRRAAAAVDQACGAGSAVAKAARNAADEAETKFKSYREAADKAAGATYDRVYSEAAIKAKRDKIDSLRNKLANVGANEHDWVKDPHASEDDDDARDNIFGPGQGKRARAALDNVENGVNDALRNAQNAARTMEDDAVATAKQKEDVAAALAKVQAAQSEALRCLNAANNAIGSTTDWDATNDDFMRYASDAVRQLWLAQAESFRLQIIVAEVELENRALKLQAARTVEANAVAEREAAREASNTAMTAAQAAANAAWAAADACTRATTTPPPTPRIPGYHQVPWDVASD